MNLGYRDYIAARVLLNNHLIVQGLALASTSLEKYLKALIVFNLKEREKYHYHFDRFEKLKDLLCKVNKDVTEEFDPFFLEMNYPAASRRGIRRAPTTELCAKSYILFRPLVP